MRVSSLKNDDDNIISSFYSNDQSRMAEIVKADGFLVRLYNNGVLEEIRHITKHNMNYVEDLAENFVEGIGFSVDKANKIG